MARETKAERQAREAEELALALAQRKADYPQEFLVAVADALNENFELVSVDPTTGLFTFRDRDDSDTDYNVPNTFISAIDSDWPLDDLQLAIEGKRRRREEFERQRQLRQQGLSKLSPEERAALGL